MEKAELGKVFAVHISYLEFYIRTAGIFDRWFIFLCAGLLETVL